MRLLALEVCAHYYPQIVNFLMLTITYKQWTYIHMLHTTATEHVLVQEPGHGTSVMVVLKMGNTVPNNGY